MKEFEYERTYLHRSMIITNNFHKDAILVKSPLNSEFGIWFPKCFTGPAHYKNYFWVNISKNKMYEMYKYKGFKICEVREIRGITLIEEYQNLKTANSKVFLTNSKKDTKHPLWNPEKDKSEILEENTEIADDEEMIVWD